MDSDLKVFCRKLGLTNASKDDADEISWQLSQILSKSEYIKFNDAIGSVRQKLADQKTRSNFLDEAKKIAEELGSEEELYTFLQSLIDKQI